MIEIQDDVEVGKDPESIFDFYIDVRNEMKYNPSLLSARLVGDGPIGVGTKFECEHKQMGHMTIEIARADRPKALGMRMTGKMGTGGYEAQLAPSGAGTKISGRMSFDPKGARKLMAFMAKPMMRKEMQKTHRALKEILEKGS